MGHTINNTINLIAKKFNLSYLEVLEAFINECKKHVADEQKIQLNEVTVDVLEHEIYLLYNGKRVNINNISVSLFTKIKRCTAVSLKNMVIALKNKEIERLVNQIVVATIIKVDTQGVIAKYMDYNFYVYNKSFIPSDVIAINYKYKFMVVKSQIAVTGIHFTLWRNCVAFVRAIIVENIPEIKDNSISIVDHYRIAGNKNFIQVSSNAVDNAVALCVGYQGMRIKSIMQDIGGEKIVFLDKSHYTMCRISSICVGKTFCAEVIYVLHNDAEIVNNDIKVTVNTAKITIYASKYSVCTKIHRNNRAIEFIKNVYNVEISVSSIGKIEGYKEFIKHAFNIHDEHTIENLYKHLPTVYHFYHFEPLVLISIGYKRICRKILSLMLINISEVSNEQNIDYIISKNITVYQYKIKKYNEDSKS